MADLDFTDLKNRTRIVESIEIDLQEARSHRDSEIRRLRAAGATKYRLAQIVGISQTAITKIIDQERI